MMWHRLRMAGLVLLLVWSALSPLAGEAMARVTGDDSWLLCAREVRTDLSAEDNENLAVLARLSGVTELDERDAPERIHDVCLGCPLAALAAPGISVSQLDRVPTPGKFVPASWSTGRIGGIRLPEPRAPPLADLV